MATRMNKQHAFLWRAGLAGSVFLHALASAGQQPAAAPTSAAGAVDRGGGIGDLLVAPTRVVLEGRDRSAEVSLINIGAQAATYRISFVHMAMTDSGDLKEVEKPSGTITAEDLVRYSPRQITLEPNVAQVVRMQLRKPAGLPDGEYRAHMLFRAVPREDAVPQRSVEEPRETTPSFSIKLTPIYGVSIPVIVRSGQTSAKAEITDVRLRRPDKEGDVPVLECRIHRNGNQSIYGNLTVAFAPAGGPSRVVGAVNGVAVYVPNPFRILQVPLQAPPGTALQRGRLVVAFSKAQQNGERLADATLDLP